MNKCFWICMVVVCVSLFFIDCQKNKAEAIGDCRVSVIRGSVKMMTISEQKVLTESNAVQSGSYIQTDSVGVARIEFGQGRVLFMHSGTRIKVLYERNQKSSSLVAAVTMDYGEVFLDSAANGKKLDTCTISTPNISVVPRRAGVQIRYDRVNKLSGVQAFAEPVTIFPTASEPVTISSCMRCEIDKEGKVSPMECMTNEIISALRDWAKSGLLDAGIPKVCCTADTQAKGPHVINYPPVWKNDPAKVCTVNVRLQEKLKAEDPEKEPIRYELMNGPSGMTVTSRDGMLSYTPKATGSYEVQILAADTNGNANYIQYTLKVVGKMGARLFLPSVVSVGVACTLNAENSYNESGLPKGLSYRFSANGEKNWEYPANHGFGKEKSVIHIFDKPGNYTVSVEIRNMAGQSAKTSRSILVQSLSRVMVKVDPPFGSIRTNFALSVSIDSHNIDSTVALGIRWDFENDKVWDYPSVEGFSAERNITHSWKTPGVYTVIAEVNDGKSLHELVSTAVTIFSGPHISEIRAPDTVNINEKIEVVCVADDPDFKITQYSWDFAGTGVTNEASSKNSGTVSYSKPGIYSLVCAVENEKGMKASEVRKVVVRNNPTLINIGKGYEGFVNSPIKFRGTVKDVDSKIVSYTWDFGVEGQVPWKSDTGFATENAYAHQGVYTAKLEVTTDEGTTISATVPVKISNRPPKAFAGEDVVSRPGKKLKLAGIGKDPDNNISQYAWDFNGDGSFEWTSDKTGEVTQAFEAFSMAIFRVSDGDGADVYDTIKVVICPDDMEMVKEKKYCIDPYEFPNKKGAKPVVNISQQEASEECQKVGKRLCSLDEYVNACKGGAEKKNIYPYGQEYIPENCNTYGNNHLHNQVAVSGEFGQCKSAYDTYDMSGNVAEWTATGSNDTRNAAGGWWQSQSLQAQCDSYLQLPKDKKFQYVGFRCCK